MISKDLAIITYLASQISDLYQTKLYKLLFYIDFLYYKNHDTSITGELYYKLPFGPVPLGIKSKIDFLINENNGIDFETKDSSTIEDFENYKKYLHLNNTGANSHKIEISKGNDIDYKKYLNESEISIINKIISTLGSKSTAEIVEISHKEEGYIATDMFRPIFFGFAKSLSI